MPGGRPLCRAAVSSCAQAVTSHGRVDALFVCSIVVEPVLTNDHQCRVTPADRWTVIPPTCATFVQLLGFNCCRTTPRRIELRLQFRLLTK